jgi:transcriptional regulator with XRE-family HTH domain
MDQNPKDIERELRLLGRGLRELRQRAGITQRELGAPLDLKHNYISEVEGGRRSVRWITVKRILGVLGADLHQLADAISDSERKDQQTKKG